MGLPLLAVVVLCVDGVLGGRKNRELRFLREAVSRNRDVERHRT